MSSDTRNRFIEVARRHFADKGFEATSIAAIAEEVGLTKQALLHHFGSKEKLYGEVLEAISTTAMDGLDALVDATDDPIDAIETLLIDGLGGRLIDAEGTRILMRELLDNQGRAESARTWYLKPYLEELTALVKTHPATAHLTDAEALATVYQLIGAMNYLVISEPTLSRMFGKRYFAAVKRAYPDALRALVKSVFKE